MTSTRADGVAVGERVVRRVRSALDPMTTAPPSSARSDPGWLAVTVLPDVDLETLPPPLTDLGDEVEVRVRPAAGGKGTELRARLRDGGSAGPARRLSGTDREARLRAALREAKQVIEVGEVLRVDPAPHGERPSTPAGLLLEAWTRAAPRGGVR